VSRLSQSQGGHATTAADSSPWTLRPWTIVESEHFEIADQQQPETEPRRQPGPAFVRVESLAESFSKE
jgi:hypothetical protein